MKSDCVHKTKDGKPSIIFDEISRKMIYPPMTHGICKLCGKTFHLTEQEYKDYRNGGEIT